VPLDDFLEAIGKDKKNVGSELRLVLPDENGRVGLGSYPADDRFRGIVAEYLDGVRGT
jgi:3-dehydroquinate synthetase